MANGEPDYTVKIGDTLPVITATLYDANGLLDLTGATSVKIKVSPFFSSVLQTDAACTFVRALGGPVSYQLLAGDFPDNVTADYNMEFEVKYPDGSEITCPNDGYLWLQAVADLG